jgi:hypothetical protein
MKRTRSAMALLATIAVAGVIGAGSASAVTRYWNSSSVPLTARSSTGAAVAQAYGDWRVATGTNGTESRATGRLRDPQPTDGDPVYYEMKSYTNSGSCLSNEYVSCSQPYYYDKTDNGGEYYSSSSWSSVYYVAHTALPGSGNYARAGMRSAEEHNNLPDIFSGQTLTYGNSY